MTTNRWAAIAVFSTMLAVSPAGAQTQPPPFVTVPLPAPPPTQPAAAPAFRAPRPTGPLDVHIALSQGSSPTSPRYDIEAKGQDVVGVLDALSKNGGPSMVFIGHIDAATTVTLRRASAADAVVLIARSAGLLALKQNGAYLVGAPGEVAAALGGVSGQVVYHCEHVNAQSMATAIQAAFDPQQLKATSGPGFYSPTLVSGAPSTAVSNDQGSTLLTLGESDVNLRSRDVVLSGNADAIGKALVIAMQVDHPRLQVRIDVKVSDVSVNALRQLGIQWAGPSGEDMGTYSLSENATATQNPTSATPVPVVPGIKFGKFAHLPYSITATILALEKNGDAKLLAEPSIALLDGERSFILIGQRLLFPHLVSSYYGSPTYDVQEVRVGVYLQVAVKIGTGGEDIILTLYPQVSSVTDTITVNGGVYPIIDTREQQTTIRAVPGETVVIGGLIRDNEIRNAQRVPILGRIPILGELFRYRDRSRTRSELVMTLTPYLDTSAEQLSNQPR